VFRQWAKGVHESVGDFVWLAEADDVAYPSHLEQLIEAIGDPDGAIFAFSDSQQIDDTGMRLGKSYAPYCNEFSTLNFTSDFRVTSSEFLQKALATANTVLNVSAVLFVRRPLARALQHVEDELGHFKIAGDWRLYIDLCSLPGDVCYVATATNIHRRHSKSVVGANHLQAHIAEISEAQKVVARLTELDSHTLQQQSAYQASLKVRASQQSSERSSPERRDAARPAHLQS
jgi:hypothetical protein